MAKHKRVLRLDAVRVIWEPDPEGGSGHERCHARAEVSYPVTVNGDRRLEWLTSGGLHGIERATGAYRREVEREQIAELRQHLAVFGVDQTAYPWARHEKG